MELSSDMMTRLNMHQDGKAIIVLDLEERALIDAQQMIISVNERGLVDAIPLRGTSVAGYLHKTAGNSLWLSYVKPERSDTEIEPVLEVQFDAIRGYKLLTSSSGPITEE
jgi:hypothetical protein